MGAGGIYPLHLFGGRQYRVIGVQEVASPIGKLLVHGADRHVECPYSPEERVTRDGLDERALDELDRIGRWMEASENASIRIATMYRGEAVEHRREAVDQRPAVRVIEHLGTRAGAGAREGSRGGEQTMQTHETHSSPPSGRIAQMEAHTPPSASARRSAPNRFRYSDGVSWTCRRKSRRKNAASS